MHYNEQLKHGKKQSPKRNKYKIIIISKFVKFKTKSIKSITCNNKIKKFQNLSNA